MLNVQLGNETTPASVMTKQQANTNISFHFHRMGELSIPEGEIRLS